MADGVAVLGLQVDASGALVELKKFDDATKKAGDTASKTQAQVAGMGGGFKAADGTILGSYQALVRYEGALNRAANEQRRAANMARDLAAAEQAQAVAALEATAAQKAMSTAAGFGEAQFNRLRGSLTGLLTPILGTVGSGNALVSTLSQLTVGAGATVGILAGVAAIGAAYDVLSEKAKLLKEATEKARKALDDLARTQRQGIGGELAEQIGNQIKALEALRKKQGEIAQQSSGGFSQGKIGIASDADLSRQRDIAAKIKATDEAIAAGKRELARVIGETDRSFSQSQTRLAADLAQSNGLTIAEQAKARDRLKTLKADIEQSLKIGGDQTERARLIADFNTLNAALNPAPAKKSAAANKEVADSLKELRKAYQDAQNSVEEYQAGLSKGRLDAFDKDEATAKAQAKAADDASKAQAAQAKAADDLLDPLRFQVDLIGKTKIQVEQLTDLENYRIGFAETRNEKAAEEYVQLQRQLRAQKQGVEDWKSSLSDVVGIVQLVAAAFGDVGREITKAASGAGAIVRGLQAAKDAKTTSQSLAAAGTTVGGFIAVADAISTLGNRASERARELRQAAIDFNNALEEFAIGAATTLETQLRDNIAKAASLVESAGKKSGISVSAVNIKSADDLDKFIADLRAFDPKTFGAFANELSKLSTEIKNNEQKIRDRVAAEEAAAQKDLSVRLLRAQGLNAEADAAAQAIADAKELQDAVEKFGEGAVTAAIRVVQSAEAIARAAKKAEAERRSITDLSISAQAFTDPRGAGQAAFEETQRRRLSDAIERNASAAELAAINLYNLAEAADRAAQIAEQDRRTQESLIARVLGTFGNDRATQDFVTGANQRQEIADAIRNGMSPSNLALLQFTQRVENSYTQMQRAIEDGTKAIQDRAKNEIAAIDVLIEVTQSVAKQQIAAIDAQIKETQTLAKATAKAYDDQISAIREQTKAQTDAIDVQIESARSALEAANATVAALDKQVQTNQKVVEALQAFQNSVKLGDLSTLSPEGKLAEARRQFEALASAAQGGNADAATQLPSAAQALLQASRAFNASGSGYVNDFNRVQSIIDALTQQFGATLPIDQQALDAARQTVVGIQGTIDALGKQKDTIQKAADAQIAVLQKAKDKAAADAQAIIDKLTENKQKIQDDTAATVAKLEETKTAIQDAATRQIEQLVRVETEAHQFRIRQDEYWQQFLGTGAFNPTGNGPETLPGDGSTTPPTVPILQSQLAAQQEQTRVMSEKFDGLTLAITQLMGVTATANDEEVGATVQTTAAVQNVATQIRQLGQALVARSR